MTTVMESLLPENTRNIFTVDITSTKKLPQSPSIEMEYFFPFGTSLVKTVLTSRSLPHSSTHQLTNQWCWCLSAAQCSGSLLDHMARHGKFRTGRNLNLQLFWCFLTLFVHRVCTCPANLTIPNESHNAFVHCKQGVLVVRVYWPHGWICFLLGYFLGPRVTSLMFEVFVVADRRSFLVLWWTSMVPECSRHATNHDLPFRHHRIQSW